MNQDAFDKVLKISEEFFGTQSDPDQMPINQESANKLMALDPDSVVYKFDDDGNPIGWAVVVPTGKEVMDSFLHKELSEHQLLDEAVREKKCEALYLCAAFVLPEYRRKGYASALLIDAIRKVSDDKDLTLYAWIYSNEGKLLLDNVSKILNKKIYLRED